LLAGNSLTARQLTFLGFGLSILALDQLLKEFFLQTLKPGQSIDFLGSIIRFTLVFNDGAAFSFGSGQTWIFTVISTLAAFVLAGYSFRSKSISWSIMAGVLLGGILGNLIDRLFRPPSFGEGHVIDYIQIPFNFPIFNIADIAIVTICSISVLRIMLGHEIGKETPKKS
jgi:signal peptidase II